MFIPALRTRGCALIAPPWLRNRALSFSREAGDADGRKGKVGGFPPSASRKAQFSAFLRRIIHIEFDRARRRFPTHNLFPFQFYVRIDLIVAEHVAARQECAVVLQADERFAERSAY